jgi:hypothetical protein
MEFSFFLGCKLIYILDITRLKRTYWNWLKHMNQLLVTISVLSLSGRFWSEYLQVILEFSLLKNKHFEMKISGSLHIEYQELV